ncbi:MAG: alanine--tRNA ligase, partial [Ruminococcus sp.]|nr:alanine--tRNA ligase [Ruminococcus sp.]
IECITCNGVLELLDRYEKLLHRSAAALKASSVEDVPERCAANIAQIKALEKEKSELDAQLAASKTGDIMAGAKEVNGIKINAVRVKDVPKAALRTMGDEAKDKYPDSIVLFADTENGSTTFLCVCGKKAVEAGANAGKIVKDTAAVTGGKGGGRPDSAMAGAGDSTLTDKAVEAFADIAAGCIG